MLGLLDGAAIHRHRPFLFVCTPGCYSAGLSLWSSLLSLRRRRTIQSMMLVLSYLPSRSLTLDCDGCEDWGLDLTPAFDRTYSPFKLLGNTGQNSQIGLEFNFTGTALYIFMIIPAFDDNYNTSSHPAFAMDGVPQTANYTLAPKSVAKYNVLGYANEDLSDGPHTFGMSPQETLLVFDYAVYTYVPVPAIGEATCTTITFLTHPYSTATSTTTSSSKQNNLNTAAGAIAGAVVGGLVALSLAGVLGVICTSRARRRKGAAITPRMEESGRWNVGALAVSKVAVVTAPAHTKTEVALTSTEDAAQGLRILREQVRRFEERTGATIVTQTTAHHVLQQRGGGMVMAHHAYGTSTVRVRVSARRWWCIPIVALH
ncbi:hypothetical protein B0H13DRAFT_2333699 [Mycena leptocephala]|nr:hypothetical protein B0H13DRAFT_2333699 [Mycena leptocephala]